MQKITVLITKTRILTFHNVSFSTLDSTDFLEFRCKNKTKSAFFFFRFLKNKKHGALRNWISEGSMFFVFWKSKKKGTFGFFNGRTPEYQYCLERYNSHCEKSKFCFLWSKLWFVAWIHTVSMIIGYKKGQNLNFWL